MEQEPISIGQLLEVLAIVVSVMTAIIAGVWFGGRWSRGIEKGIDHVTEAIEHSRTQNTVEHAAIGIRLDKHCDRIGELEIKLREPPK